MVGNIFQGTVVQPTAMSSMSTPADLLQLKDGRILCSHASRGYPGSIHLNNLLHFGC